MPNPLYELVEDESADAMTAVPHDLAAVPDGCLLDTLGMRLTDVGRGSSRVEMTLGPKHLNQRGLPQGGAFVALADAAAGWASYAALPEGRFTTVRLGCDLLGRAEAGTTVVARTRPIHLGRRTLVLDVDVLTAEQESAGSSARRVARFSCTQLVLGSES